jgi:hypothetical protein
MVMGVMSFQFRITINGGGQECPPYTVCYQPCTWTFT